MNAEPKDTIIFTFGDSITQGIWDPEGGWVGRLNRFLMERVISDEEHYFLTYNLGISGDSTEKLLLRFRPELEARLRDERNVTILFAIGINDSLYINDAEPRTTLPEFRKNIITLKEQAADFTSRTIFIGLTEVDESKTAPFAPWRPNYYYRNRYIEAYDAVLKEIGGTDYIPMRQSLQNFTQYLDDGLHPNSTGHQRMFETVQAYLLERKFI